MSDKDLKLLKEMEERVLNLEYYIDNEFIDENFLIREFNILSNFFNKPNKVYKEKHKITYDTIYKNIKTLIIY